MEGRRWGGEREGERDRGEVWLDGTLLHSPWGSPPAKIRRQRGPRLPEGGLP